MDSISFILKYKNNVMRKKKTYFQTNSTMGFLWCFVFYSIFQYIFIVNAFSRQQKTTINRRKNNRKFQISFDMVYGYGYNRSFFWIKMIYV